MSEAEKYLEENPFELRFDEFGMACLSVDNTIKAMSNFHREQLEKITEEISDEEITNHFRRLGTKYPMTMSEYDKIEGAKAYRELIKKRLK